MISGLRITVVSLSCCCPVNEHLVRAPGESRTMKTLGLARLDQNIGYCPSLGPV